VEEGGKVNILAARNIEEDDMISRRLLLKGTATAGSVLFAPAVLRATDALASAGQVNVFAWGDYIQQNQIDKFEGDTGIKISLSTYGSNDEALQKLKASGGKGFDVIFPSITTGPMYYCVSACKIDPLDGVIGIQF
jgi:spermidine/putrescine transport system substrate-binding protein